MCLGELGSHVEFGRLFMPELGANSRVVAELAYARLCPDSITVRTLSIAQVVNPFLTLNRRRFTLLAAMQNSFAPSSAERTVFLLSCGAASSS